MPEAQMDNALYFDNTRVSAFFKCPRAYYFRHVRGWSRDTKKPALAFGGAIHSAMEVIWAEAKEVDSPSDLLRRGMTAFVQKWEEEGFSMDEINMDQLRNPGLAMDILAAYLDKYYDWLRQVEVIAVEQPFIIPVMHLQEEDLYAHYIGRWDKVWKDKNGNIFVGEHKTTSLYRKIGDFAKEWVESFSPDNQVDGYAFAAHAVYGTAVRGVMIDGILVHKTVRAFTRIPVQRAMRNLNAWLWGVQYWINEIVENGKMLQNLQDYMDKEAQQFSELGPESERPASQFQFMSAFPQRTEHCNHKYGQCEYLQICKYADANPERMVAPPDSFIENPWDPFAHNVEEGQQPMIVGSGMEDTNAA